MGAFDKLKKDDRNKKTKQFIETKDNDKYMVQMIEAEVIAVGCEVTGEEPTPQVNKKNRKKEQIPERFSYRYKFKDPSNPDKFLKAYDELITVEIGEQIYDVGETLQVLFSNQPSKENETDFTVTRKIIFPEIINKKKKKIKIIKRLYTIFFFTFLSFCMCYSISNSSTEELDQEETSTTSTNSTETESLNEKLETQTEISSETENLEDESIQNDIETPENEQLTTEIKNITENNIEKES